MLIAPDINGLHSFNPKHYWIGGQHVDHTIVVLLRKNKSVKCEMCEPVLINQSFKKHFYELKWSKLNWSTNVLFVFYLAHVNIYIVVGALSCMFVNLMVTSALVNNF